MVERCDRVLRDLAELPPVGTPQRRAWDLTVREANELYPDWSAITVGTSRLRRQTYEQHYKGTYEGDEDLVCAVAGAWSSGYEGPSEEDG